MNIDLAKSTLLDKNTHIAKKMRSLFYLRNIKTEESALILCEAFKDTSVLLKHEVAYVLGQMLLDCTIPVLIEVLNNENEDEIVRHEAGEALGNFPFSEKIAQILEKNIKSNSKPVSETCFIAFNKINLKRNDISVFNSRDPAYPLENVSFEEATKIFLSNENLYKRYEAMFFLRNLGTKEAIKILGKGMDDESALFKHEIAFICGQMANPLSTDFLIEKMNNENEHGMVRHECAEALGIIGNEKCLKALVKFKESKCDILRESVEVAIDLHGYVNSDEKEYCVV